MGIEEQVRYWLEPVLKKNGNLAGLAEIAPIPGSPCMAFNFTPRRLISKADIRNMLYPILLTSLVEAFEIPEQDWKEPPYAGTIRITTWQSLLDKALKTGTASELHLAPGDLVSLTSMGGRSHRSWQTRFDPDIENWTRTIGVVTRGPSQEGGAATILALAGSSLSQVGALYSVHGGFRNYRRLKPAIEFAAELVTMARQLMKCGDRVVDSLPPHILARILAHIPK